MTLIDFESIELERQLVDVAQKMVIAATTAPKARGLNQLSFQIMTAGHIGELSQRMIEISKEFDLPFFERDSKSILNSPVVLLIGCRISPIGLKNCSYCGFESCAEKSKHPTTPCAHNSVDIGIALGVAAKIAQENGIDNRIMFSAGKAALDLGYFQPEIHTAYAMPLSVSSKNIFFDR